MCVSRCDERLMWKFVSQVFIAQCRVENISIFLIYLFLTNFLTNISCFTSKNVSIEKRRSCSKNLIAKYRIMCIHYHTATTCTDNRYYFITIIIIIVF